MQAVRGIGALSLGHRQYRRRILDLLFPPLVGLLLATGAAAGAQSSGSPLPAVNDPGLSAEALAAKAGNQNDTFGTLVRRETAACVERFAGPQDCTTLLLELLERWRSPYNYLTVDAGPVDPNLGHPTLNLDHEDTNGKLAYRLALMAPDHVLARYGPAQPFLLIGDPGERELPAEPLAALARAFQWDELGTYSPVPDMMLGNAIAVLLIRADRPTVAAGVLKGPGLIKIPDTPDAVLGANSRNFAIVLNTQGVLAELRHGKADRDSLRRAAAILAADPASAPIEAAVVHLNLARAQQEDGDYEDAENAYRRWLPVLGREHPGYANVLVDRARALGALGRGDEAMALLDQALAMLGPAGDSDRLRAVMAKADALVAQGKHAQAEAALGAALKAQAAATDKVAAQAATASTPAPIADASMPQWLATKLATAPQTDGAGMAAVRDPLVGEAYRQHAQMLADAGRKDEASVQVAMARRLNARDADAAVLQASLKVYAFTPVNLPPGPITPEWTARNDQARKLAVDADTTLQSVKYFAGLNPMPTPASIGASSALGLLRLKQYGLLAGYGDLQKASKDALVRIGAMRGFAEAERNELGRYRDVFRAEMIVDLGSARLRTGMPPEKDIKTADALVSDAFVAAQWAEQTMAAAALGRVAARFAAGKGELAALERTREDLARQVDVAQRAFLALLGDTSAEATVEREAAGALRDRLASELAELERRMVATDPAYADLTRPVALTTEQVRALLDANEALVMLIPAPDATYVIAMNREGVAWHRSEKLGEAALGEIVERLRAQISSDTVRGTSLGGGPARPAAFDRRQAHLLYQELIAPVATTLAGKSLVMTVTTGSLGKLPLALLVTEPPSGADGDLATQAATQWLIDRHALTTLPAVSSLRALRCLLVPAGQRHAGCGEAGKRIVPPRRAPGGTLLAGFGAPALAGAQGSSVDGSGAAQSRAPTYAAAFNGALADTGFLRRLPSLPGSLRELDAIAGEFPAGRALVVTGTQATETRIKQSAELAEAHYVIFSTHGLLSSESGVRGEPGLVFTPPPETGKSDVDDGLLTASEAAGLRLRADLVILSACNTAASDGSAGGEGLSGLARGFFFAGARSLMVSHWPVSDAATSALITAVFKRVQAGDPAATALQHAIHDVRANPRWSSPAFWAPFVLVGAGS